MKSSFALLIIPALVAANPAGKPDRGIGNVDKRAVTCGLTGSDVKYHRGPSTGSIADGQFGAAGTQVSFSCYTVGESVNGDTLWNRIASGTGAGDYVTDFYISSECSAQITARC
ncbi:hypothetical protein BX600DRAFT_514912 [Xylariales sp. PMI_506]|nr:hypothetical protein BX600DRAFT_514912 [Xylariales sp. PMI_506]